MSNEKSGVGVEPSKLKETDAKSHAIRFAFGGLITAAAGLIAKQFGPVVGGLFLGFPAILPASLVLVRKREGKEAAGEDARGAILGSVGLVVFALVVWGVGTRLVPWAALAVATLVWLFVSVLAWLIYRRLAGPGGD